MTTTTRTVWRVYWRGNATGAVWCLTCSDSWHRTRAKYGDTAIIAVMWAAKRARMFARAGGRS